MFSKAALSRVSGIAARSASASSAMPAFRGSSSDAGHSNERSKFWLSVKTMNPFVLRMQYEVRGRVPSEAERIADKVRL